MNRIVKTQSDWNALPESFSEYTVVEVRSSKDIWITVNKVPINAHVEARESAHVEARGSAHVVARGSAHVVARESAHVEAWGTAAVHVHSEYSTIELAAFAVAILLVKVNKLLKKSKTCTVVEAQDAKPKNTKTWAEWNGAPLKGSKLTIFKRVSKDLKTQKDTANETTWTIGAQLEVPNWNPVAECGAGKFHACFCPSACDHYHSGAGDRYIAVEVDVEDTHFFKDGSHPNKISFKKGKVLFECDRFGKPVNS